MTFKQLMYSYKCPFLNLHHVFVKSLFYKGLSTERILSKLLSWDLNAAIKIPGRICAESKDSVKEIMTFRVGGTGGICPSPKFWHISSPYSNRGADYYLYQIAICPLPPDF